MADAEARTPSPALGPLGYGAANVGNLYRAMSEDEAWSVLDAAWESGVRYFDTAPHYGLGLSERRLGAYLATKPRADFVVSTKVGRLLRPSPATAGTMDLAHQFVVPAALRREWDFSAAGVRASLTESLERLGLDRVDVLYLHDPEEFDLRPALAAGVPALVALREEGLVDAVGVGSKSVPALLAAVRTDALDLLMVAGRLTLVEQPVVDDVLPACRERGVGVVAAAVYNSGLLASPAPDDRARYEYGEVPRDVLERARRIEAVCRDFDVALPVAALQYPLTEPGVRSVVVGGASPDHVVENSRRMRAPVPPALWHRLIEEGLVRR